MPYAQLDDGFYDHPRFEKVDDDLVGIWAKGLAYCSKHLTDGRIPKRVARTFCVTTDPSTVVARMIDAKLWADVGDGVSHIGYLDHNPSREQVRARQLGNKIRKERWKTSQENAFPEPVPNAPGAPVQNRASPSSPSSPVTKSHVRGADVSADVRRVFDHWQRVLAPLKFKRPAELTAERRRVIETRLKEATAEELCQAIDGVLKSPHHCGTNDTGEVYIDLPTIFRNRTKVEGHRARADGPPARVSAAERETRKTGRMQEELMNRFDNR